MLGCLWHGILSDIVVACFLVEVDALIDNGCTKPTVTSAEYAVEAVVYIRFDVCRGSRSELTTRTIPVVRLS